MITYIWITMVAISFLFALLTGNMQQLSVSVADGAGAAVQLCIGICGVTCLWAGLMKVMDRCGISSAIARLLRPILGKLYPNTVKNDEAFDSIAKNTTANLLGIGNAATPAGIRAVTLMAEPLGCTVSDEMCRLVVMNTASIQLIPTTVAAVRASAGAASPFDIIPAVWITSLFSCAAGLVCAKLLSKIC